MSHVTIESPDRLWGRNRLPTRCTLCGKLTVDYVRMSYTDPDSSEQSYKTAWLCAYSAFQSWGNQPSCESRWINDGERPS